MTAALNVLIASPLEPEHAARIEAADPRVSVLYEPDLLPVPRYPCDHTGVARELSPAALAAGRRCGRQADVSFDFDWQAPADMAANCPRLRWVQGTSAGIGGFLDRTGLAGTPVDLHHGRRGARRPAGRVRAARAAVLRQGHARARRRQAQRHWQRHAVAPAARLPRAAGRPRRRRAGRSPGCSPRSGVEVDGAGRPGPAATDVDRGGVVRRPGPRSARCCPHGGRARPGLPADRADPAPDRQRASWRCMRPGAVLVNIAGARSSTRSALIAALSCRTPRRRVPGRVRDRAAAA